MLLYLATCLSTGIARLVCAQRLPVRTCTILVGDGRRHDIASADVGIVRLGQGRCRDEDQNRRCAQNTFHSILLFDVTWSPPWRFPTHVHPVAVNCELAMTDSCVQQPASNNGPCCIQWMLRGQRSRVGPSLPARPLGLNLAGARVCFERTCMKSASP